jgi:hypothetical protein
MKEKKELFAIVLSWTRRGFRGEMVGGDLTNVLYKLIHNCQYESLLYN